MEQSFPFGLIALLLVFGGWTVGLGRRLRNIEHSISAILRHFNIDPTVVTPPSDRVKELAADPARRIEAMRLYRQESRADLRVAKATIDALVKAN